jgi:transposase InsO family protein
VWTREGWLYLAVVIDLFARRIVGWATGDRLHRDLALAPAETLVYTAFVGLRLLVDRLLKGSSATRLKTINAEGAVTRHQWIGYLGD